jgi:hypothetical protein
MPTWLRKTWPAVKLLLTAGVLAFVGRAFTRDLADPRLWQRALEPGWLMAAAALYLVGLGFSAWFWHRLLTQLGQRAAVLPAARAYYLGHFGKHVPGKAWALLLRVALARSAGIHSGIAGLTAFYEVLTTMAAGACVAAAWFGCRAEDAPAGFSLNTLRRALLSGAPDPILTDRRVLFLLSLGLAALLTIPLAPPVFNRLVHWVSLPFRRREAPAPRFPVRALAEGLCLTVCGWFCLGASLWAVLKSLAGGVLPATWEFGGWCTAAICLAYVAGFAVIVVPNGLGVREYLLALLLAPTLDEPLGGAAEARAVTVLAVLVLRLVWTAAEVVAAAALYAWPVRVRRPAPIE